MKINTTTMNRRFLSHAVLMIIFGISCLGFVGCGGETPTVVNEKQKNCEHDWGNAKSGDVRCKKCDLYKPVEAEKK